MPEFAVLNPDVQWRADIDDAIGPDYGWERLRRSQLATVKPAFGQPWSRTVGNGGHTAQFSWLNRSRKCVEMLKQWAEQHEDGFFTVIDHDGGGRHYVGNFVGDMPVSQAGHDRYNIQGWTFEEIPGCPMLEYPSDWDHWAVMLRPYDDYGAQRVATVGAWARPDAVVGDDGVSRQARQIQNLAPTIDDTITMEYRGYGFRLWAVRGDGGYGSAAIVVDGVQDASPLDLHSADEVGPEIVYERADMPLDVHRVQVRLRWTVEGETTPTKMVWDKLEVMR